MQSMALMAVIAAVAIALSLHALHAGWRHGDRTALAYAAALLCWVVLWGIQPAAEGGVSGSIGRTLTRVVYQASILSVTMFLLGAVHGWGGFRRALTLLQAALGVALALVQGAAPQHAWFWMNALLSASLLLWLAHTVWHHGSPLGWMALLVGVSGLGLMLTDLRLAGDGAITVSTSHYFYLVALFVLQQARTQSTDAPASAEQTPPVNPERQRLAQELHDGVGSHLASIISALDLDTPWQRATAASLNECMAELKLLVDGMDSQASLLSHLASLRYRMQPLLAAAGIELRWQIADEAVLESVRGDAALQFLRLAQEAMANVVRHSGASQVVLTCCQVEARQALMLEIADNGVGIPAGLRTVHPDRLGEDGNAGKGLRGMARRAQRLGGLLLIDAAHGQGTCIRLLTPLTAVASAAPAA
ncbi:sensor histidine kinase [Ottowia testudinis]|uniref:Oxygen sensor histidine kinase NreB n=1 Tax=Ottowia testudinis TaxID=2816950 RepID=A0A975CL86_9BURK|nr:ATP-binding protein [Ottowia testudinis]QTD47141.1 hypothetical protein J1M35_09875 [Ottowia testudinis]